MTLRSFDSVRDYLAALADDPTLATVSVSMAADALGRTRAGTLLMLQSGKLDGVAIAGSRYVRAQSLIKTERDFMDSVKAVTRKLEQIARGKELTTYTPIMELVGLKNVAPDRRKIGVILDRASRTSFEQHRFLISALVCHAVGGKPRMPGNGFWPLAENLLDRRIRKEDHDRVFQEQLRAIYEHYAG